MEKVIHKQRRISMDQKLKDLIAVDFSKGLARPAIRALATAFTQLDQLAGTGEAELLNLHGMGRKAMTSTGEALTERGLTFADLGKNE
jgi:hypothetical protein